MLGSVFNVNMCGGGVCLCVSLISIIFYNVLIKLSPTDGINL